MNEVGAVSITIAKGWENAGSWSSIPAFIAYWLGPESEHIFSCYYTRGRKTLQLTDLEATGLIKDKKALVDAYLYVAIKGIINNAKTMGLQRLIIDSYIPSVVDHMLDLGFRITPKSAFGAAGGRGCKILED
jgi:hypothetical protein